MYSRWKALEVEESKLCGKPRQFSRTWIQLNGIEGLAEIKIAVEGTVTKLANDVIKSWDGRWLLFQTLVQK